MDNYQSTEGSEKEVPKMEVLHKEVVQVPPQKFPGVLALSRYNHNQISEGSVATEDGQGAFGTKYNGSESLLVVSLVRSCVSLEDLYHTFTYGS